MILANKVNMRNMLRFQSGYDHLEMRRIISIMVDQFHEIKLEKMTRDMVNELAKEIDGNILSNMLKGLGSFVYIP